MKFKNYLLKLESQENKKSKENICVSGASEMINKIYLEIKESNKSGLLKKLEKELHSPYSTIYCWISGSNPIPIYKAYVLLKLWQKELDKKSKQLKNKWDELYTSTSGYSQNGQRTVKLPKEFNKTLAYIMGFFQGDGHLAKEKTGKYQEYSLHFFEEHKEFLEKLNKKIIDEFGIKGCIYEEHDKIGSWFRLRICSKPIYIFFKNILGLTSGKKVRNVKVPKIIKESNRNIQLSFIKGFFDAEGAVGEHIKNPWLEIGQASAEYPAEILVWMKKILDKAGINMSQPQKSSGQDYFRLRISKRETIKRFFKLVSTEHQNKIIKFKEIIEKCH